MAKITKSSKSYYSVKLSPKVINRARLIFIFLILAVILFTSLSIYSGVTTGDLQTKLLAPAQKLLTQMFDGGESQNNLTQPQINFNYDINSEDGESLIKPLPSPTPITKQNNTTTIKYTYPTYTESPASIESSKKFMEDFNKMSQENAEKQKQVEEAQKKFCQDHPSVCQ